MNLIGIMVAVNYPSDGVYSRRCGGITIPNFIELEPVVLPDPRCTLCKDSFSIHRKKFLIHARDQWVGNWCWDQIFLTPERAGMLLEHVLSQRWQQYPAWSASAAYGETCIALTDRVSKGDMPTSREWTAALLEERSAS